MFFFVTKIHQNVEKKRLCEDLLMNLGNFFPPAKIKPLQGLLGQPYQGCLGSIIACDE
jgi:hypothetical protein